MARQIPLKTTLMRVNGGDTEVPFVWAELIEVILKSSTPQRGLTLDEVLKALDALKPLQQAKSEGADHVTFSEDQYRLLRAKLDEFPFSMATPEVAEFGLAIRDAQEIT